MSPRLASSSTSAPAARARATASSSTASPARAVPLVERHLRLEDGDRAGQGVDDGVGEPAPGRRGVSGSPHSPAAARAGRCRRTAGRGRHGVGEPRRRSVRAHRCAYPTASRSEANPRCGERGGQLRVDPGRRGRVVEHRRPHRDRRRPGEDELQRVQPAADAAHAEDRHLRQRLVHLPDAAQRHRADRRPGQPAGDPAEHRPHRVRVDDQAEQGVDHRQPVGAGVGHRAGDARRCR